MNDFLLNLFTGTDKTRPLMMFPNLYNGIVYATDTLALITIPENELSLKYSTNTAYPDAQKIIDDFEKKELQSIRVNVVDLAKELTKARIEVDKDSIKCKECKGSGTVEFKYEDKTGETHYIDGDCPICYGEGSSEKDSKFARIKLLMIEKEDGTQVAININDLYFHPFQLYRLFMVASIKRIDDFEILFDPNRYGQVISNFGNIKVLTMLYARPF
jgi:hypothetical protein